MRSLRIGMAAFAALALASLPAAAFSPFDTTNPEPNLTVGAPVAIDDESGPVMDADNVAIDYRIFPVDADLYIRFEPGQILAFDPEIFAEDMDHAEDQLPTGKAAKYYLDLRGVGDSSMNEAFLLAGMFREEHVVIYVDESTKGGGAEVAHMIYQGNPTALVLGNSDDEAFNDVASIRVNLAACGEEPDCLKERSATYLAQKEQLELAVALHNKIAIAAPALAKN